MTVQEYEAIGRALAPAMRDIVTKAVQAAVEPVWMENRRLEMRVLELETRPQTTTITIAGPQGERGADGAAGANGNDGAPGRDGRDGIDGHQGAMGAEGLRGPQGEKGMDGLHGRDGRDGAPGLPGMPGEKGLDGRHGADGLNGKDGADGLSIDDADLVFEPERGVILRIAVGGRVKDLVLPTPFYVGNWTAGERYPKGAEVRHGGHVWMALTETKAPPGEAHPDWQLLVSRGKEGRPGKDGAPGMDPLELQRWVEKVNR